MPGKVLITMFLYVGALCIAQVVYGNGYTSAEKRSTCKGYRIPPTNLSRCYVKANRGFTCDSSNRTLNSIPKIFPGGLYEADFSHNGIHSLQNDSFEGCNMLRILDLSYNRITLVGCDTFKQLPNLVSLKLMYNDIIFENPTTLLDNNPNLRSLYIENNGHWQNGSEIFQNKTKLKLVHMDTTSSMKFDNNFSELKSLRKLVLFGDIHCVTNKTFEHFGNLTHFVELRFAGNGLQSIDQNALSHLKNISTLNLNNNKHLGFESVPKMTKGLEGSHLKELRMRNISQAYQIQINTSFYASFENISRLSTFDISNNNIAMVDFLEICKYIPKLSTFELQHNMIYEVKSFEDLSNCKVLQHLNVGVQNNQVKTMSQLPFRVLNMSPSIQKLYLNNAFKVKRIYELTLHGAQKLRKINLGYTGIQSIHGPLQLSTPCTTDIEILLNQNIIKHISKGAFHLSLSKCIRVLSLSRNKLGSYFRQLDSSFFQHFDILDTLDLSYNKITTLKYDLFNNLAELKQLRLGSNLLTSLFNIVNLHKLTYLDLSNNAFALLQNEEIVSIEKVGKEADKRFKLNIFQNPLICTCDSIHFLEWLLNTPVNVTGWADNECQNFYNETFSKTLNSIIVPKLNLDCHFTLWLTIGGSCLGVIIITTLMSVFIYRKRWHIRYWCIKSARARKRYQYLQDTESFENDAFVMYSSEDLEWITHELVPNLEKQNPGEADTQSVELCLHHRDFIGGNYITENIVEAIDNSRKCILVLSRSFCKGEWTHFEMQMARARAIHEGRNIIIVIRLEEVPFSEMSNTLLEILKTQTYVEYPTKEEDREEFWSKVKHAIKEPC